MRKSVIASVLLILFTLLSAVPVFAAVTTWEELTAEMENKAMVRITGRGVLERVRQRDPQGTELELWNMLWVGEPIDRAAAGLVLMERVFPCGSPGRWEEARGFLSNSSRSPRQLAGLDAFFVTIAALETMPDGPEGAAILMENFSKSARGMIYFIEQMPKGLQAPLDSIIAKTGLRGDWSAKTIGRPLPLLPVFAGAVSRNSAESRRMVYLDGAGRIAGNGYYAWDRNRGYLYQVVEDSERFWRRDP